MNCPQCHGSGFVRSGAWRDVLRTKDGTFLKLDKAINPLTPCDYPGCHGGVIQCCCPENDGLPKSGG